VVGVPGPKSRPTTDLVDYIKEWFAARQSQEA
jgi:hypothetical protein